MDSTLLLANNCEAVSDPCDGVDCHGGVCSEGECTCTGIDGYDATKFVYSATCEKTGCVDSEYTLENGCEAVTLAKCEVFGGGTVNVNDLGCKDDKTLVKCIGDQTWDENVTTCAFGCADNACKALEGEESYVCIGDDTLASLNDDRTGYASQEACSELDATTPYCGTVGGDTLCYACLNDDHCGTGESCVDGVCEAAVAPTCETFSDCEGDFNACIEGSCKKLDCRSIDDVGSFRDDFGIYDPWCDGTKVTYCDTYKVTADESFASCVELTGENNNEANCSGADSIFIQGSTKSACVTGIAPECTSHADCTDPNAPSCIAGTCDMCTSDEDCGEGEVCDTEETFACKVPGGVEPTTLSIVPAADCTGYEAQDGVESCSMDTEAKTVTLDFANGAKVTMALASITDAYLGLVNSDNSINITNVNGLSKVTITAKLNKATQSNSCLVSDSINTDATTFSWTGTTAESQEYSVAAGASSISIVGGGASTATLRITSLVAE